MIDRSIVPVVVCVLAVLVVATLVGRALEGRTPAARATVANLRARVAAWWWMVGLMLAALAIGRGGVVLLFAAVSVVALRELLVLVPAREADQGTLVLAFVLAVPIQYGLVWVEWYGLFSIFLPVWALLAISVRIALSGDTERFLHRVAAIQYALTIGVYCVSHAPALLMLSIEGFEGQAWKLLVFLLTVVQACDVLQYLWGKAVGRRLLAPRLSPSKTVEGLVGGVLSATAIGAWMAPLTPFSRLEATGLAFVIAVAGSCGGAVMSAIKRDAGVKDYGTVIAGHGGMLDRVDSLAFAAPVFFHLVRWLHAVT